MAQVRSRGLALANIAKLPIPSLCLAQLRMLASTQRHCIHLRGAGFVEVCLTRPQIRREKDPRGARQRTDGWLVCVLGDDGPVRWAAGLTVRRTRLKLASQSVQS